MSATALMTAVTLCGQPPDDAARAQRARELAAAGKSEEAIEIYRELVRSSPTNAGALMNLSIAEYTAKRYADAAAHAAEALHLEPDLITARLFLGASRLEMGEFQLAIESLRQVVAANPRERNARLILGEALLKSGSPAEALDHLREAAAMLPNSSRAWYALGRAHEALGQSAAAMEAWKRLAALEPSLESRLHAAEVAAAGQRWREAALAWQEALRLAPEREAIRVSLADAQFRSRDYQNAMSTLKPLLGGKSAEAKFLYGASLLNLQLPLQAMPYLNAAIALGPGLLPARAALGQALLQTGKPEEAIDFLRSGLPADEDGSIHFQLFRAYQLTKRDSDARQALAAFQRFRASLPRP